MVPEGINSLQTLQFLYILQIEYCWILLILNGIHPEKCNLAIP